MASTVVKAIEGKGLTELWQVEGLSQEIIGEWFPQNASVVENLAIKQIQKTIAKQGSHAQVQEKDTAM